MRSQFDTSRFPVLAQSFLAGTRPPRGRVCFVRYKRLKNDTEVMKLFTYLVVWWGWLDYPHAFVGSAFRSWQNASEWKLDQIFIRIDSPKMYKKCYFCFITHPASRPSLSTRPGGASALFSSTGCRASRRRWDDTRIGGEAGVRGGKQRGRHDNLRPALLFEYQIVIQ